MKIISGSSNKPLAEKIAHQLGQSLSPVEIFVFPDGERRIRIEESVVDEDVVIVQSTATPVDQHYMELFFLIDSAKRSGARSVTVVMPYFGYMRQDHVFRDGEAVSLQVVLKILESLRVDRIISYDLHVIRIPELTTIPVTHLSALTLFAQEIKNNNWLEDTVIASPDMGGINRVRKIADMLSLPYVTNEKNRDVNTGEIDIEVVHGDVKKHVIMVDDMISSGKTIVKGAELLREKGAEKIHVFASHPIFSQSAPEFLENSLVENVYVTDTVDIPENKRFPKLQILSIAEEIAEEIKST